MKVALLSPYSEISSIGLRSISAYLKSFGIATRLVFLPLQKSYYSREDFPLYPARVTEGLITLLEDDDLIGISLMSHYYESIKHLTITLKKAFPEKPVIWGGIHPTVMPEECLKFADFICIGEGELPCLTLCRHLVEGKPVEHIPGIWSKIGGHISRNNPESVVMDLNQFPPPDYDLDDNYILLSQRHLVRITTKNAPTFLGTTYWTMYTRGCPFSCTYCCNDALRTIHKDYGKIRAKSPEYIVQEIRAVKDTFPFMHYVNFQDDTLFALPEKDIEEFCRHYTQGVALPFMVPGIHPSLFSEKKFDCLVRSGMYRARMGIQTGSKKILTIYNRKQDNETIIQASYALQKYSKKLTMPNYDIIVDNPWETQEDILHTIDLLSKLAPPFSLNIFSLTFFPGTSLFERALRENIIHEKMTLNHYLNCKPTYLNLIIALLGVWKIPPWLLRLLLSKPLINTKRNFGLLHRIIYRLMLFRRGLHSIRTRDFSMFPPRLQLLCCKILPPRIINPS